jgi:hypothetical protein
MVNIPFRFLGNQEPTQRTAFLLPQPEVKHFPLTRYCVSPSVLKSLNRQLVFQLAPEISVGEILIPNTSNCEVSDQK